MECFQKFLARNDVARARARVDHICAVPEWLDSPVVAPGCLLAHGMINEAMASHGDEQAHKLLRRVELEFTRSRAHEKVAEYRLGDVCGIEHAPQARVSQPSTDGDPDRGLI